MHGWTNTNYSLKLIHCGYFHRYFSWPVRVRTRASTCMYLEISYIHNVYSSIYIMYHDNVSCMQSLYIRSNNLTDSYCTSRRAAASYARRPRSNLHHLEIYRRTSNLIIIFASQLLGFALLGLQFDSYCSHDAEHS
jgi:hypothetical protein